ncbi:hypothetical protein HHA02_08380 [Cobetia marina]|nr:hypothetical protein HHA02_08380 [Cobetia marina]
MLEEAWEVYSEMIPGFQPVPSALVGDAAKARRDASVFDAGAHQLHWVQRTVAGLLKKGVLVFRT